ncbi:EutN/CcmL family microcompartment protein [Bdellovibrionota bacterium FG-2]
MQLAFVQGTVVASQKVKDLQSYPLKVLQACDHDHHLVGEPFVAVDAVGARTGDLVIWVGKREASLAIPGAALANNYPVDAAVTGIVDDHR